MMNLGEFQRPYCDRNWVIKTDCGPWPSRAMNGAGRALPHTSAGRVPTDRAYRFYVDHLEQMPWMAAQEAARHEPASPQIDPAEQIMADIVALLQGEDGSFWYLIMPIRLPS